MASADVIRPRFLRPNLPTALKEDVSPVTEADREAELVMRRMIESRFPAHGILGEEYGTVRADAEFVWVLDPIDGTKSFITGVPLFATLIGLLHRGRPVLGCIHQPILNQLMIGDRLVIKGRRLRKESTGIVVFVFSEISCLVSTVSNEKLIFLLTISREGFWGFGEIGRAHV